MTNLDELQNKYSELKTLATAIHDDRIEFNFFQAMQLAISIERNVILENSLFEEGESNLKVISDYLSDIHTQLDTFNDEMPETHKRLENIASAFLER